MYKQLVRNVSTRVQQSCLSLQQRIGASLEDKKQKNTIPALDGVRAIACLTVVAFHVNLITRETQRWSPGNTNLLVSSIMLAGASGVTLFFILSGFLLFLPYAKVMLFEGTWPSARKFYLRRAFRIIPAYYVALCLIILFSQPQFLQLDHLKDLTLFLVFFMDSTQATYQQINGPFWTLAVEWQYYLLLPLLAGVIGFIARRGAPQRRFWTVILCLIGVIAWGLCSRYWGLTLTAHPTETLLVPRSVLNGVLVFTYGVSGKYLEDFAVGMLISVFYVYARNTTHGNRCAEWLRRLNYGLWGSGIVILLFMALWHFDQWYYHSWSFLDGIVIPHPPGFPLYDWLNEIMLSIGFGLCVTAILFGPTILRRPFEWFPLRWIGFISYSLYMWHLPLLVFFMTHVDRYIPSGNHFLVYSLYWLWIACIIIPFCYLSFLLVEKPWIKIGSRFLKDRPKEVKEAQAGDSEICTVPSSSPEAMCSPSGDHATVNTSLL
ncbi:MAG: acyltransferase family protein [Ktedonobacteraceae bacterium]